MRALCGVVLTLIFLQSASQEPGTISGIVLTPGTNEPIESAQLFLTTGSFPMPPNAPVPARATTDDRGRFEIVNVPPGRYRLHWERNGYFPPADSNVSAPPAGLAGTDAPSFAASNVNVTVELGPRQQIRDLVLPLIPGGVISGRIVDAQGKPLAGSTIMPLRLGYQDGNRVLNYGGNAVLANDRGEFRLFGLWPSEYYVRADYRRVTGASAEVLRAYFPGVAEATAAATIKVSAGSESRGSNFSLQRVAVRIAGRIVNAFSGTSLPAFFLQPADITSIRDNTLDSVTNAITIPEDRRDGLFELRGISPGRYALFALIREPDRDVVGHVIIDVGMQDLLNVPITLDPGSNVSGGLTLIDGASLPRTPIRMQARVRGPIPATLSTIRGSTATTDSAGAFTFSSLPDLSYAVTVSNLPQDLCVVDVRQDGKSVYDEGMLPAGGPIELVLSGKCGSVQIRIANATPDTLPRTVVALVPAPAHRGNIALYRRAAFVMASSSFAPINGVPPGEYKLFAWESIPSGAELNAEFLQQFEDRGVSITVMPGNVTAVEVPVIPAEK